MDNNQSNCQSCGAALKKGLLNSNTIVSVQLTDAINQVLDLNNKHYCNTCVKNHIAEIIKLKVECEDYISLNSSKIPIITTHHPYGWQYKPVSIVTGQVVIGTGVISEFTASINDFFGASSNAFSKKVANGEITCFIQLRDKAIKLGCDAVIATDIDYSELGGLKGMIMVCASGTAVKVSNIDILGEDYEVIQNLKKFYIKTIEIRKYQKLFSTV